MNQQMPSALEQAVLFLLDMEEYTGEESETAHHLSIQLLKAVNAKQQRLEVDNGHSSAAVGAQVTWVR